MKETVSFGEAVVASEVVLPLRVPEALGELVGVTRKGLLALRVGVGLGVLAELMEEALQTYAHFADRDPLTRVVLERMLAGVSTRRYRRTQEPVGATVEQTVRSTSKSAVSRAFVERTRQALGELMAADSTTSGWRS